MTFYSLAMKNIKRNFRNYSLYIFSTTLSIFIYYAFSTIRYNDKIFTVAEEVLKFKALLQMSNYIIAFVVVIFIWYANTFFMKKRKKEVALFSLVGVKKTQIGRMLLIENALVALISLVLGILIGIIFSKFLIMILLRIMLIRVEIPFSIPIKSVIETTIIFAAIFLVVSVHSYTLVYRVKIIDLFHSSKKKEQEPKTNIFMATASIILIGCGYYLSQHAVNDYFLTYALIISGCVIIGTFPLFSSFTTALFKYLKRHKKLFYKGTNLITLTNLTYKLKSHARTLAIITLLTATTISAMGSLYGLYVTLSRANENEHPYSYVFREENMDSTDEIVDIIEQYPNHKILDKERFTFLAITTDMQSIHNEESYFNRESVSMAYSKLSDYNQVAAKQGLPTFQHLEDNECILVTPYYHFDTFGPANQNQIVIKNAPNERYVLKDVVQKAFLSTNYYPFTAVVSDEKYHAISLAGNPTDTMIGIEVKNEVFSQSLTTQLKDYCKGKNISITDYYTTIRTLSEKKAVALFSGFFLGVVFLIATGSIIYLKLITEAYEEKDKFIILRKLGFSYKEIKTIAKKQIFIIFAMPLIIGIIHACFALSTFNHMLVIDATDAFIVAILFFVIIYFAYYWLTVNYYNKVLSKS